MNSLHRISVKRISFYSTLFRGRRFFASGPKSFLPLDLIYVRKSQPILSLLPLTKEFSKTSSPIFSRFDRSIAFPEARADVLSQTCLVSIPVLTVNTSRVCVRSSIPSNLPHHQPLLPLKFFSESPYHQFSETLENSLSLEKISVFRHNLVYPTETVTEVNGSFSEMNYLLSSHSSRECVTSTFPMPNVLFSQELSFDQNYLCMNRNARHAKRANRGKRPCSRQRRRSRRRQFGNHRR